MKISCTMSLAAMAALSASTIASQYEIHELGTLGGSTSFALDLNGHRQVSGNAQTPLDTPPPRLNAFLWSPPTGPMINLGVLPGSNNFSRGYAVNDHGVVVGESDNNNSQAFIWQDGVMSGLTSLEGGNFFGVAHDINNENVVVGISRAGTTSRPTKWTDGVPEDLGSTDGLTTSFGRAWAINDAGVAVGVTNPGGGSSSQATLWMGAKVINLGSLLEDSFSEAFGVSNINIPVGAAVSGATGGGTPIRRAVRWLPDMAGNFTIEELGSLGLTFSEAKDINDAGAIVGFATNISGFPQVAWVWENGVMTDLNDLLPPNSGWSLRSAEGINNAGDIVGFGVYNGDTRAFLLVASVTGDLNGDGVVDVFDLLILLSHWGACPPKDDCPADLNGDGVVDVFDLLILLSNWG